MAVEQPPLGTLGSRRRKQIDGATNIAWDGWRARYGGHDVQDRENNRLPARYRDAVERVMDIGACLAPR